MTTDVRSKALLDAYSPNFLPLVSCPLESHTHSLNYSSIKTESLRCAVAIPLDLGRLPARPTALLLFVKKKTKLLICWKIEIYLEPEARTVDV